MQKPSSFVRWKQGARHFLIRGVRPVFLALGRDFRTIFSRKSFLIMILALCFLPACYSGITLYAYWDPYSRTDNLPVAIVNNDEGATFGDQTICLGDDLVASLQNDTSAKWVFLSSWQANYGVNSNKYYAMLEIPSDFSQRMVSLSSDTPQKPVLHYILNQKINAVAGNILRSVESKLLEEVRQDYIKLISQQIDQNVQDSLDGSTPTQLKTRWKDQLSQWEESLNALQTLISQTQTNTDAYSQSLQDLQANLPTTQDQLGQMQGLFSAGGTLLTETRSEARQAYDTLLADARNAEEINTQNQALLADLQSLTNTASDQELRQSAAALNKLCQSYGSLLGADLDNLETVNGILRSDTLTSLLTVGRSVQNSLQAEEAALTALENQEDLTQVKTSAAQVLQTLSAASQGASEDTLALSDALTRQRSAFDETMDTLSDQASTLERLMSSVKELTPIVGALAGDQAQQSQASAQQLTQLSDDITQLQSKLSTLTDGLSDDNPELDNILNNILGENAEDLADFLASPVEIDQQDVYQERVYGYGLAPFYSTLSIWVGVMLLSAMVSYKRPAPVEGRKITFLQGYFSRLLLFLILSEIQTPLSLATQILLVGLRPADIGLFFLMGMVCSLAFTLLIFTISYFFGTIGSGLALVIMAFQMAGSGGIFPLETSPSLFGRVAYLWPFTYANSGFKEALQGPLASSVNTDLRGLLFFAAASLAAAFFVALGGKITGKPIDEYLAEKQEAEDNARRAMLPKTPEELIKTPEELLETVHRRVRKKKRRR